MELIAVGITNVKDFLMGKKSNSTIYVESFKGKHDIPNSGSA